MAWEPSPTFGQKAYDWTKKVEQSSLGSYVTASPSIYEVMVILAGLTNKKLKNNEFTRRIIEAITNLRGLMIEAVTHEEILSAQRLMMQYNLDYEDALHLSVAAKVNAKEIVSDDIDFENLPIESSN